MKNSILGHTLTHSTLSLTSHRAPTHSGIVPILIHPKSAQQPNVMKVGSYGGGPAVVHSLFRGYSGGSDGGGSIGGVGGGGGSVGGRNGGGGGTDDDGGGGGNCNCGGSDGDGGDGDGSDGGGGARDVGESGGR